MKMEEILARLRLVNKTVDFLEDRTDNLYRNFENIEDCNTLPCEEEKTRLRKEMGSCLSKLRLEEKELGKCEAKFTSCSGELI